MTPQSVAYAGLAGMPFVTGLYATFLPMLAAVLFSSSTRLAVGPSALSSVLVGVSLVGMAEPGTSQWVLLAVWLALLSGAMQLAVGASGAAWMLHLMSSPVLVGFSQAAAILIVVSELPKLLGLHGPLAGLVESGQLQYEATAYGLVSLAIFEICKRKVPKLPAVLLVLAAAAVLSWATGYATRGDVVGSVPAGMPEFFIPAVPSWETFGALLAPALVLALVSSMEMAASAKIESQHDGKRWDANQDLIGQGIGKVVPGLCGSFPTSTSFSRAAITLYSGAKTGWATVIACGVVFVVLLFLTPALYHVPSAALAAVVVAAVLGLFKPGVFSHLWCRGSNGRSHCPRHAVVLTLHLLGRTHRHGDELGPFLVRETLPTNHRSRRTPRWKPSRPAPLAPGSDCTAHLRSADGRRAGLCISGRLRARRGGTPRRAP
nr:SulP family inorganic anion transporter [Caenimonas soli]